MPNTPLPFLPIEPVPNAHPLAQRAITLRPSPTTNMTVYISSLTDYLDLLMAMQQDLDCGSTIWDCSYVLSSVCPWDKCNHKGEWLMRDELHMVLVQLSLAYNARAVEVVEWQHSVKLYKKSLSYLQFAMKHSYTGSVEECSDSMKRFYFGVTMSGLQLGVICTKLKELQSNDYELDSRFNVATLSRVCIWIKDELNRPYNLVHKSWNDYLLPIKRFVQGLTYTLLSCDSYNQSKMGESLGWLSLGLLAIQSSGEPGDDQRNKIKSKLHTLKRKVKKNVKLDQDLLHGLPRTLQPYLQLLFEMCQVLEVKYSKLNDQFTFDTIVKRETLLNQLPLGRSIPMDIPDPFTKDSASTSTSGYY